jgi:hypothetical protein
LVFGVGLDVVACGAPISRLAAMAATPSRRAAAFSEIAPHAVTLRAAELTSTQPLGYSADDQPERTLRSDEIVGGVDVRVVKIQ